jgi:formylglycine-generating enzyme required for sulfatase activity
VRWAQCYAFCERLGEKERAAGKIRKSASYRLPTEAEWEYACRAGTTTRFSFGDDEGDLSQYAWYKVNSDNQTHPVGRKRPNPWGLFDMHGNVSQWCSDCYGVYPAAPQTDPSGLPNGEERVERGGCYLEEGKSFASAARRSCPPSLCYPQIGFRVVLDPGIR